MSREMIRQWQPLRKYQTLRINSPRYRFFSQIFPQRRVVLRKPQRTVVGATQYAHPGIEYIWKNLVIVVEAAEYSCLFGKAALHQVNSWVPYCLLRSFA